MMSSAISTDAARSREARDTEAPKHDKAASSGLLPWHFFALVILAAATAVLVASRGASVQRLVMLFLVITAAGIAGLAVFRTLQPLVRQDAGDRTVMVGRRTRTSLERQKLLILRAIKEFEFDYAMKKVSDADVQEMTTRLRSRAAGIIRQLEAGDGYREQIERELHARLAQRPAPVSKAASGAARVEAPEPSGRDTVVCDGCRALNEADARFCKACGQKIA